MIILFSIFLHHLYLLLALMLLTNSFLDGVRVAAMLRVIGS